MESSIINTSISKKSLLRNLSGLEINGENSLKYIKGYNEDINSFYKANVYKKYLESNEEENNNNKNINNANRSPKTKKLRNIPEEDKKALNSFLNEDDDESETENEIEE